MQWTTDLSSLANQARFGIELFEESRNGDNGRIDLIKDGLKLCEILSEGAKAGLAKSGILPRQIGYLEAIKPLVEDSIKLENLIGEIDGVSQTLKLILANEKISKKDIDFADSFLVRISQAYQRKAFSTYTSLVEEKVFY